MFSSGTFWHGPTAGPFRKSTQSTSLSGTGPTLASSKASSYWCFGALHSSLFRTSFTTSCPPRLITSPNSVSLHHGSIMLTSHTDGSLQLDSLAFSVVRKVSLKQSHSVSTPEIGRVVESLLLSTLFFWVLLSSLRGSLCKNTSLLKAPKSMMMRRLSSPRSFLLRRIRRSIQSDRLLQKCNAHTAQHERGTTHINKFSS